MTGDRHAGRPTTLGTDRSPSGKLAPDQADGLLLRRVDQLSAVLSLSPDDRPLLSRAVHRVVYGPGEIVVPRRARAECLGLLVSGQVAVIPGLRPDARPERVLLPGSFFGEEMLVLGQPSSATLRAVTDCEVWLLRRHDVQRIVSARRAPKRHHGTVRVAPWAAVCLVLLLAFAHPDVRQAVAVAPMGVGEWCRQHGHLPCAETAWTLASRLAEGDVNPLLALGTLYFERGQTAAAERVFVAALALAPNVPELHNNLGLVYASQGRHERALAAYRRALELEPGSAVVEHNLGASLQALAVAGEAAAHYRQALALGEPQAGTLANMAVAYYEAGDLALAGQAARQALVYDPAQAAAHAVLGAVALASGQTEAALPELHRAVALGAGDSATYCYLGLAYRALDRPDEARAAFERALSTAADEETRVRIRRYLTELTTSAGLNGTK